MGFDKRVNLGHLVTIAVLITSAVWTFMANRAQNMANQSTVAYRLARLESAQVDLATEWRGHLAWSTERSEAVSTLQESVRLLEGRVDRIDRIESARARDSRRP